MQRWRDLKSCFLDLLGKSREDDHADGQSVNQSIDQSIKVNYKATSLDQPGGGPANKVKALISEIWR